MSTDPVPAVSRSLCHAYKRPSPILLLITTLTLLLPMLIKSTGETYASDLYPPLAGSYRQIESYPRVFRTEDDLRRIVANIKVKNSLSEQMFHKLVDQVITSLSARVDWEATYSGCDIYVYLRAFSFEASDGYPNELKSDAQLRIALDMNPTLLLKPPRGAAVVASRLALYAALVKAGAPTSPTFPLAEEASTKAREIVLAWARRGFQLKPGIFVSSFCDGNGKQLQRTVALQISRGLIYLIDAIDLLQYSDLIDHADKQLLYDFLRTMYDSIRKLSNDEADLNTSLHEYGGAVFNNQFINHVTALLAIARWMGSQDRLYAAIYGENASIPVKMPWIVLFNNTIYGINDHQREPMFPNTGADSLSSHPSFVSDSVAPGEINDRFRNSNPAQGIGYPMFSLERLFDCAELLRISGYDPYGYRGLHHQSLEMSLEYYSCLGLAAGLGGLVTAENAQTCPDFRQYIGQVVNGVDVNTAIGALRFPNNQIINKLYDRWSASKAIKPADSILFGYSPQ